MLLYKGMKIKCDCKVLPPKGYSAITLFGTVYTRKSEGEVVAYLQTDKGKIWINHEAIHIMQKRACRNSWILFYALYIFYFFKMWPFYTTKWDMAYKTIPFEAEAYACQEMIDKNESGWKKYVKTNKMRKAWYNISLPGILQRQKIEPNLFLVTSYE